MKIVELRAENIKKISVIEIKPDGNIVQITGRNGSGKTSVLDSIWWALAGVKNIQSQPIKKGSESARIRLNLGELIVTRKFLASGTTVTVENGQGAKYPSPQKMLDELLGALTFDPLAFSRMEPKKQFEQLRNLVKLDIDIEALDEASAIDYEKRTEINHRVKSLESQITVMPDLPSGLPDKLINVSALVEQLGQAGEHNAAIDLRVKRHEDARKADERRIGELSTASGNARRKAADLCAQAERLMQQAKESESDAMKLAKEADAITEKLKSSGALPDESKIELAEIKTQIDSAQATNKLIAKRDQLKELIDYRDKYISESEALTAAMNKRTQEKQNAIASAKMPVNGLGFGNGEVLFNAIPFDQASSAEQLRISCAIAMASNPKLRVLRITDGSLLDDEGLQLITSMADENDYQVWIERVDSSGKVGIMLEDGHIAGEDKHGDK